MSDLKKIFGYILSSKELEDSLMDVAQVISDQVVKNKNIITSTIH